MHTHRESESIFLFFLCFAIDFNSLRLLRFFPNPRLATQLSANWTMEVPTAAAHSWERLLAVRTYRTISMWSLSLTYDVSASSTMIFSHDSLAAVCVTKIHFGFFASLAITRRRSVWPSATVTYRPTTSSDNAKVVLYYFVLWEKSEWKHERKKRVLT